MAPVQSYWLISVPNGDNEPLMVLQQLKTKLESGQTLLANVSPFQIPELKVGTLDALVLLSEDLGKHEGQYIAICTKLVETLKSLLGDDKNLMQNLVVNERPVDVYIRSFVWNSAKYRPDKPLKDIFEMLTNEANAIDSIQKIKYATYNQVKTNLTNAKRKQSGNLASRTLDGIVKKEHLVLDSEYMETLLVAVPKSSQSEWLNKYERLTDMIVPRSSIKIDQDDEYALYNVTLFRKVADEFKAKCRDEKFIVREYKYDADALSQQQGELKQLEESERELWTELLRLTRTNYGEMYQIYVHLKALQVFVESVLRFGLPPDFTSATIKPAPRADKSVLSILHGLYGNPNAKKGGGGLFGGSSNEFDDLGEWSNLVDKEEFFPWVHFKIATWSESS